MDQGSESGMRRLLTGSVEAVRGLVEGAKPAVFRLNGGGVDPDRLLAPDDLRKLFAGGTVSVSVSRAGGFRSNDGERVPALLTRFDDFADYVERGPFDPGELRYLSQFPLEPDPMLAQLDPAMLQYLTDNVSAIDMNLWFGPAGTLSPFHFDRSHNFLHQHRGRKHVMIVDPIWTHLMNAHPKESGSSNVSMSNFLTADRALDLRPLPAPFVEVVLEPGEVLFIPAFWWHHVVALDPAISMNYWWRPPMSACLHPNFFRMLSSPEVYHDPRVIQRWVEPGETGLSTALCCRLLDEGHTFAAAALAGAIVTAFCCATLRLLGASNDSGSTRPTGTPDFGEARSVITVMATQRLLTDSQAAVFHDCLDLAEETAGAAEVISFSPARDAAIQSVIDRLHRDAGAALEMSSLPKS